MFVFFCLFYSIYVLSVFFFFFFNDTATTEIYTLSLHDALPISILGQVGFFQLDFFLVQAAFDVFAFRNIADGAGHQYFVVRLDRKSTRLNSSHGYISYAVFCLKKKKK